MAILVKTPAEIEAMKEAGRLSAAVLRELGALVRPGVTTCELDVFAEEYIRAAGGVPTFKGYGGYPASICASVNEQIVHGIPSDHPLTEGDIVSIDVGATVDGWVGDNAWTFPVGQIEPKVAHLLQVCEECLWLGVEAAVSGGHIGDIGHAVQVHAKENRMGVVREYVGHGVGRSMHEEPNVPNYGHRHLGPRLRNGMVIAIEPMITLGSPRNIIANNGWTVSTFDGLPAAHFEKTVAITPDGPLLLTVEPDHRRPVND